MVTPQTWIEIWTSCRTRMRPRRKWRARRRSGQASRSVDGAFAEASPLLLEREGERRRQRKRKREMGIDAMQLDCQS